MPCLVYALTLGEAPSDGSLLVPVTIAAILSALMIGVVLYSRLRYLAFPELVKATARTAEDHVVIIPARNEAASIERTIRSFPGSLVVVVNDHSTDNTAAVAKGAGAEVRDAPPLPPNAHGKAHACWAGARYTESKWILFTDADTWYDAGFLDALFALAEQEDPIAISVLPEPQLESGFENVAAPVVSAVLFASLNAKAIHNVRHPQSYASGRCILVRRDAYEFIDHKRVMAGRVDSLELGRALKQHRMATLVVRAGQMAHTRLYGGLAGFSAALDRTLFDFIRYRLAETIAALHVLAVHALWAPTGIWLWAMGLPWLAAIVYAAAAVAWIPWCRNKWWSLLVPFAVYVVPLIALPSIVKGMFDIKTDWKGRRV